MKNFHPSFAQHIAKAQSNTTELTRNLRTLRDHGEELAKNAAARVLGPALGYYNACTEVVVTVTTVAAEYVRAANEAKTVEGVPTEKECQEALEAYGEAVESMSSWNSDREEAKRKEAKRVARRANKRRTQAAKAAEHIFGTEPTREEQTAAQHGRSGGR
jgi:hypothetical protein